MYDACSLLYLSLVPMRTTLAIDNDVLEAARGLAAMERRSVGEVVSDLARRGLQRDSRGRGKAVRRNGVPLLQSSTAPKPVTMELVNRLRDEAP